MVKQYYKENVSLKDRERFSQYLTNGEELVLITSLSKAYLSRIFTLGLINPGSLFILGSMIFFYLRYQSFKGVAPAILIGFLMAIFMALIKTVLSYHANRYILTTKRVLIKSSLLDFGLTSVLFDRITHIELAQTLVDRWLLHQGRIVIRTAGMERDDILLPFVEYPIEFKNILESLINRTRETSGKQTGPVVLVEGEIIE